MKKDRKIHREIVSANIIGVTVEHNGLMGGGAGHGGYVRIKIDDLASTCMSVNGEECSSFELLLRGDTERHTFIKAFKIIVKELSEHK